MALKQRSLSLTHCQSENLHMSPNSSVFSDDEVTYPKGDESWYSFLFNSELPLSPIICVKGLTIWHQALPLDNREHCLLSLQGSSHHSPRRLVFSSLQQPFLIWPALGWHIPEPKCTHKLLSLVARLFTPEWLLSGAVGHSQLDYADKEKGLWYIISTPFGFRNACLDPLPSEPTSPFLFSRGSLACSHPSSSSCKHWLMFLETEYHHSQSRSCITDL